MYQDSLHTAVSVCYHTIVLLFTTGHGLPKLHESNSAFIRSVKDNLYV